MIKEAIANYINARTDYAREKINNIKKCKHNWVVLERSKSFLKTNPDYKWTKWTYFCNKCCKYKIFENDDTTE